MILVVNKLQDRFTWKEIVDKTAKELLSDGILSTKKVKDFKEWMSEREKIGICFDRYLIFQAYIICKMLKKQNDFVVVVIGREGSGKTTFSTQLCSWVNPSFSVERICLGSKETIQNLRATKTGDALQIDEGGLSFFSREAMTTMNRAMVKIFMTIRLKSLFCVVCIPDLKSIDKYVREHRMALLVRVIGRGSYCAYVDEAIRKINQDLPQKKQISAIKVPKQYFWHGYFNKEFPKTINEQDYIEKKAKHVDMFLADMEKVADESDTTQRMLSVSQLAKRIGITVDTLREHINSGKIKANKIGGQWYIPQTEVNRLCNV